MRSKLKIIADENIPGLDIFKGLGSITCLPGRTMTADQLSDADVLLVRSVTRVDETLLRGSNIKFVGTATIGIDHLDIDFLNKKGIDWANAPGCNANSVSEYVLAALCHFHADGLDGLMGKKAGIVGYGNVGRLVANKLKMLGMQVTAYDPLLNRAMNLALQSLTHIFESDVLCVHAPLTTSGRFPSFHMVTKDHWIRLKPNACFISAGRGGVIPDSEISHMISQRPDVRTAIDVWENEPDIDWSLVNKVDIATPHIAGYSYDGKLAGTRMIYNALQAHLGNFHGSQLGKGETAMELDVSSVPAKHQIQFALKKVYDINADYERFKTILTKPMEHRSAFFDRYRKEYPQRRECSHFKLIGFSGDAIRRTQAMAFGFKF